MSAYVQDLGHKTSNLTASYAISLTAGPSAGNVVLLEALVNGTGTITSIADSKGNTWHQVGTIASSSPVTWVYQWYTLQDVGTLTSSDTVTVTASTGNTNSTAMILRELAATGLDVSVTKANNTSSTSANTGTTAATAQATEIAWETVGSSATETSWTPDTNYSTSGMTQSTSGILQPATAGRTLLSAYRDLSATGTQTASNTLGSTALSATILSTWKVASGGVTDVISPSMAGQGSLSATIVEYQEFAASAAGQGSLTATFFEYQRFAATAAGQGALSAAIQEYQRLSPSLVGVGSLNAAIQEYMRLIPTLAGVGSLSAGFAGKATVIPALAGQGSLAATIFEYQRLQPSLTGAGSLSPNIVELREFTASLAGQGSLTDLVVVKRVIVPTFSGQGQMFSTLAGGVPSESYVAIHISLVRGIKIV